MSEGAVDPVAVWADAVLASRLFAVDPANLGGIVLRSGPGPLRDQICAFIRQQLPADAPLLRVPLHITEDRLLGGLSLAATLRAGQVVAERGLLAEAHGGAVVVAMAERLEARVTSSLCGAVDRGELALERDGITASVPCMVGVVALDEGIGDERAPAALRDRLAFHVDLTPLDPRTLWEGDSDPGQITMARTLLPRISLDASVLDALCQAAQALGIRSLRGSLLAAAAARAHAALAGRMEVNEADAVAACRLVFASRATRLPAPIDEELSDDEAPDPEPSPPTHNHDEPRDATDPAREPPLPDRALDEILVQAAKSAIPPGLLDALTLAGEPRVTPRSVGQAGAMRASSQGGRPAGTRPGVPQGGERLNVVETLRAAAPWQRLRHRAHGSASLGDSPRIEIRKEDFRIANFRHRTETSVIFSVDASGSAALQRLAEAKGAVEQVLSDCYVRRDHVALIAFRGTTAVLVLPPTRSLARVRRSLADLAGGGTTPLAAGIDAALALALEARKRGQTPVLVLMTDGRGNVSRNLVTGGAGATADATSSARAVRAAGVRALFLDTAPRPRPHAAALAMAMGARYLPLPYLDAAGISRHVQSLAQGAP